MSIIWALDQVKFCSVTQPTPAQPEAAKMMSPTCRTDVTLRVHQQPCFLENSC